MSAIDSLLSLAFVSTCVLDYLTMTKSPQILQLPLSFRTAKELRGRVEILPPGPQWKYKPLETNQPTKKPVKLFYRDGVECLESLFNNPLVASSIDLSPFRLFKSAEKLVRVFSEWMSGDTAWEMQVRSPHLVH